MGCSWWMHLVQRVSFGNELADIRRAKLRASQQKTFLSQSGFPIEHPDLIKWINQCPVATKLTAELSSKDVKEDA